MSVVIAKQNETWDILALRELGSEYFAKDIMLENPDLHDTVIFDGGEEVKIPDYEVDDEDIEEDEDTWT
ncbi:MAG: hypothetical protein IK091_01615 [Spirochaetales bacterium]|nr:hypothetical protein [Spirochaetales bacterium]